jgi:hypothetical protein
LAGIVNFLQYNDFQDPEITRIAASMQITQEIRAVHINHLELDQDFYYPGDTIYYTVELLTYHGEKQTQEGEITIPIGLMADDITVRAYSGPRLIEEGESPIEFDSLADIIERIEELPSYDTLTVELFAWDYMSPSGLQGIDKVRTEITGYFLYDEREVRESDEVPLRAIHDSRLVREGDLFVALVGERTDGHAFLAEAFARGACGALVSETGTIPDNGRNLIVVEDTRAALQGLAAAWRRELPATFVGITGTCGKTTTKAILAHILERDLRIFSAPHNYNCVTSDVVRRTGRDL